MGETRSLKALADAVLRRDTPRDEGRDTPSHEVRFQGGAVRQPETPAGPCLGCSTAAWFWCADWPQSGAGRWLCRTCARRPSPSLAEVAAGLTADERAHLAAEAAAGDTLAALIVAAVAADTEGPLVPVRAVYPVKA